MPRLQQMFAPALAVLVLAAPAGAQSAGDERTGTPTKHEDAPRPATARHPVRAVAEVFGINFTYSMIDHALPSPYQPDYRVSPSSWWANLQRGFTWDRDAFNTNQIGHPYQGNNYFTAGRALGLTYWESVPLTTLGSLSWEYFGERTPPSMNDLINTTLGGAAIGEVTHRLASLVRGSSRAGFPGRIRDVAALVVNPVGGLNAYAPDARVMSTHPETVTGEIAIGRRWRSALDGGSPRQASAYGTILVDYGRLEDGPSREPFDAFTFAARSGGLSGIGDGSIVGRLASRPIGRGSRSSHRLVLVQGYDYLDNPVLLSGNQTILGGLADRFDLSPTTSISTRALAGGVVLGALGTLRPSAADRSYEYGSGAVLSASAAVTWRGHRVARVSATRSFLHTFTGTAANHALGRYSAEGRIPVVRGVHLVLEGDRVTHSSNLRAVFGPASYYNELRAGVSWAFGR